MGFAFYDPALELLPAYNGVFAVSPDVPPLLDFWGSPGGTDGANYLPHAYTGIAVDPLGLYVALSFNDRLQIYLTPESGGQEVVPTPWQPSADECVSILAWDPSRERIACDARGTAADGGPAEAQVRIFDLAGTDAVPQLSSNAMKALTGYLQGDSIAHRRSFSAGGNWLAFTTDTSLYIGNVQQAPQVTLQVPTTGGHSSEHPERARVFAGRGLADLANRRQPRCLSIAAQRNHRFGGTRRRPAEPSAVQRGIHGRSQSVVRAAASQRRARVVSGFALCRDNDCHLRCTSLRLTALRTRCVAVC